MAEIYEVKIEIRGAVDSQEVLDELVEAIMCDGASPYDDSFMSGDDGGITDCLSAGGNLPAIFENRDHDREDLANLESACVAHGLSFVRTTAGDAEYNLDGHRVVFNPALEPEPFTVVGVNNEDPLVSIAVVRNILLDAKSTKANLAALDRLLVRNGNPTRGMPEGFALSGDLVAARTPGA